MTFETSQKMFDRMQPQALMVSAPASASFMLIHNLTDLWKVVRIGRGGSKTARTLQGVQRQANLYASCHVSSRALRPGKDGFGNSTLELSGKGLYQLLNHHSAQFGYQDNVQPKHVLTDRMGLQCAEQWLTSTFVSIALRAAPGMMTGDKPRILPDEFGQFQARDEMACNAHFWRSAIGNHPQFPQLAG